MAGAFDEIAAGHDLFRHVGCKGDHRLVAEIKQLPQAEAATDVEGEGELVARRLARDRRQRLQIGEEVGDVGRLHARIGGIGEGRIVVPAAWRNAAQHGVGEILERPCADAVLRIGARCSAERRCRTASSARGRRQVRAARRPLILAAHGRTCIRRRGKYARRGRRRLSRARQFPRRRGVSASSGTRTPPRRPPRGRAPRRRAS